MIINGYVAMNKGEFDLENISFFNTLEKAKRWKGQDILEVEIKFKELKEEKKDDRT